MTEQQIERHGVEHAAGVGASGVHEAVGCAAVRQEERAGWVSANLSADLMAAGRERGEVRA